ncbi:MAG: hypothetical protein E6Q68_06240 [Polynucleobacter sp.]|nr:MAG: hypothetical protein E6Q68_06240 [Polynucleobacter sp.]
MSVVNALCVLFIFSSPIIIGYLWKLHNKTKRELNISKIKNQALEAEVLECRTNKQFLFELLAQSPLKDSDLAFVVSSALNQTPVVSENSTTILLQLFGDRRQTLVDWCSVNKIGEPSLDVIDVKKTNMLT